jgi:uncharacterized radical SAM superfamily Fe-S cluster-containing enzyme
MSDCCCSGSSGAPVVLETPIEFPAVETYCHAVTSICPECLRTIEGEVFSTPDGVIMRKNCPEHGAFECVVGSDLEAYQRIRQSPRGIRLPAQTATLQAKGCPDDCGLCPAHEEHTCLAIIEITSRCDLPCPVCLADARAAGTDITSAQLAFALDKLVRAEGGGHPPIQFAGGEPTLHPELIDFVRQAHAVGFRKMEVDSNGLLLAQQADLPVKLKEAGLSGIYLQMDGFDEEDQLLIRGRNLFPGKLKAIENCRKAGLPVVLSVTLVPDVNSHRIWDIIQFAAAQHLTGVNFQPIVLAGRYPRLLSKHKERITAGHFMREVEVQSARKLLSTDFRPTSCGLGCGLLAYTIISRDGALVPLSRLVGEQYMRSQVADFTDWDRLLQQLSCDTQCNCGDQTDLRERIADLLQGADCFSIGFHGMMDAHCLDVERAKRCCVHKLMMDGKLMPFCVYNMKYRQPQSQSRLAKSVAKCCG